MIKSLYLFLLFIVLCSNTSHAQSSGTISGRIVDKFNQQSLPEVSVAVLQNDEIITGDLTDENGFFSIPEIPAGFYKLRFSLLGYSTRLIDDLIVRAGVPTNLTIELTQITTDEIIVDDSRFSKPIDISTSFKSLSFEEIRRTPGGFEDIGRVVQTLPGVSFVNDGRNDLIVRGGSPTENLFIVDNISVPNINHFGSQGATGGPVSIINLEFIREVDFITGGFSAKYGDKLSSVLDIKLREGDRSNFLVDLNLSGTGFGAVLEGPIGSERKGSWLVSARRSYLDLIFNAAGFGFVPEYTSFQAKGVYELSSKNILTINAIGNLDKVRFNNEDEEKRQDNESILSNNQKGYVNSFELKSLLSPTSFSVISIGRTFTDFNFAARDSNFNERFKNNSKEGETSFKAEYTKSLSRSLIIETGAGFRLINFENEIFQRPDTLFVINPQTNEPFILPELDFSDNTNTYKAFAFVSSTYRFPNEISLNFGIRYDRFNLINDKDYISPRASISIPLTRKFFLNGSYGIFYQSPSYIWLVANEKNRFLKNIKAEHYVAGVEYLFDAGLRVTLEGYYKNYSNYPVSTNRPYLILANNGGNFETVEEFGLEPLTSDGTGFSRGLELFIQKTLTNNLYGALNLSLFEAKYKALDGVERRSSFDNRFIFNAFGGYRFGAGWELSGKFRYIGGRPFTPINPENGFQIVSNYNTDNLPDFVRLDLRLDKRWNFSSWSLITYIDIQNVTNKKNITGYKWNKFKSEIEANESLGILPSIGINAKF